MKIKLVQSDSNEILNITDATSAMERLMTQDKVDFVLGGFRTEAVLPMQDIAMEHKKIFIGCGCSYAELCERVAKNYNTYKYFSGAPLLITYTLSEVAFIHLGRGRSRNETNLKHTQNKSRCRCGKKTQKDR